MDQESRYASGDQQLWVFPELLNSQKKYSNGSRNKLALEDRKFHDWYRFVLSFPPHLVRDYIRIFQLDKDSVLLDPFCGTGTTIVESKINGINSIGIESNPMAHFACSVKTDWAININEFWENSCNIAEIVSEKIDRMQPPPFRTLPDESFKLLIKNSISPLPLHKALILLEALRENKNSRFYQHQLLAYAKTLVAVASNLHFGPEVGVSRQKKSDAWVVEGWLSNIADMVEDIDSNSGLNNESQVIRADSRNLSSILKDQSIDAVFTSPPYPNEKDYTRTTRLESVILGFISTREELRELKQGLIRSNTRNVYKKDNDDIWVKDHEIINKIADEIESRRIALGKTSGFERMYSKVTKQYFGGMAKHLADLRSKLKPGAYLGYVVGDQASYLRVLIRTGEILADIARSLGYDVVSIDLFRTRYATATKTNLREEVVVLQWKG